MLITSPSEEMESSRRVSTTKLTGYVTILMVEYGFYNQIKGICHYFDGWIWSLQLN